MAPAVAFGLGLGKEDPLDVAEWCGGSPKPVSNRGSGGRACHSGAGPGYWETPGGDSVSR